MLYKSCQECEQKCCKTGPGPYKTLSVEDYLENFSLSEAYNTRCKNLSLSGKCKAWGTDKLPIECRVHVCTSRSFSKKELATINKVTDFSCAMCHAQYILEHENFVGECEVCEHKWKWAQVSVDTVVDSALRIIGVKKCKK